MSQAFLKLSVLDNVLWLAGFLCQAGLALILLLRRNLKGYPLFVGYIVFAAMTTPALFLTSRFGTKHEYFWLFWIVAYAADPLQFILVIQVARSVLHPLRLMGRNMRRSTITWGFVVSFAAATFAFGIGPPGLKAFDLWEHRESMFSSLFICSALLLLSAYSVGQRRFGHPNTTALAQGLFVWSYVGLLQDLYHSLVGWNRDIHTVTYVREITYLSVLVYWMFKFWKREKAQPPLPAKMLAYLDALHDDVQADIRKLDNTK